MTLGKKPFENLEGKDENDGNPLFHTLPKTEIINRVSINLSSVNTFNLNST